MKEKTRIISLFEKLYSGDPWLDIDIESTLRKVSYKKAASRTLPNCNTIWEIVNHMIQWRRNVLRRVQGEVIEAPSNNYIWEVEDASAEAWQATLDDFAKTHREWVRFLKDFEAHDFDRVYPTNEMTYYEHIHGIIQHDAYHLGQIVLLNKC